MIKEVQLEINQYKIFDYAHPFRLLYAGFWGLVAVLCLYFLLERSDPVFAAGFLLSTAWGVVTLLTRHIIWLTPSQLIKESRPRLWRRTRRWALSEIKDIDLESSLSLADREITRPLQYQIFVHERSGHFRPLIVVHRRDDALQIIAAVKGVLETAPLNGPAEPGLQGTTADE